MNRWPDIESNPIYESVMEARLANKPVITDAMRKEMEKTARICKLYEEAGDDDPAGWDGVA